MENENLKDKIANEMTVDYKNALEKNFELAKKFVKITKEGKVDVQFKEKLTGKEQILLYTIGKLYAKEVGYSPTESVSYKELMEELGMKEGSVLPWLKDLRDSKKIKQMDSGEHTIPLNLIENILKEISEKVRIGMNGN